MISAGVATDFSRDIFPLLLGKYMLMKQKATGAISEASTDIMPATAMRSAAK